MRWFLASIALFAAGCATTPADTPPLARDTEQLFAALAREHPGIYRNTSEAEFARHRAEYRHSAAEQPQDALARLAELVARVGDGHTILPLLTLPFDGAPPGPDQLMLPLRFEWFDDGLFVVGADSEYRGVVGARVEALGGVPVETALARTMSLLPHHTPRFAAEYAPEWLLGEIALRFAGVARDGGAVRLSTDTGGIDVRLISSQAPFDWLRTRSGGMTAKWVPERPDHVPTFWSIEPVGAKAIHWRITELRDREGSSLAAAAGSVAGDRRLILDLRDCIGGDGSLIPAMLAPLAGLDIVALTGRRTHSACVMLVSALERRGGVRFVGQATGDAPNHYGETNLFILPNTKLLVIHASRYWQTGAPDDRRRWRVPDVAVPFLHSDYAAGRDPALEKALSL